MIRRTLTRPRTLPHSTITQTQPILPIPRPSITLLRAEPSFPPANMEPRMRRPLTASTMVNIVPRPPPLPLLLVLSMVTRLSSKVTLTSAKASLRRQSLSRLSRPTTLSILSWSTLFKPAKPLLLPPQSQRNLTVFLRLSNQRALMELVRLLFESSLSPFSDLS